MKKKILFGILFLLSLIIFLVSFTKGRGLYAQLFRNPYKEAKIGDWFSMRSNEGIITKNSCIAKEDNTVTIQTETFLGDERVFISCEIRDVETGDILKMEAINPRTGQVKEITPPSENPPQPEYIGTEKVKVPAGEFECEHYRTNSTLNRIIDVWISTSDYLPFPLIVKMAMGTITMCELVNYGKSHKISLSNNEKDLQIKESALFQNFPNPVEDSCWMPFQLSADSNETTIEIYNIVGQRVRTIEAGPRKQGSYTQAKEGYAIFWDGKNDAGEKVANGLYSYQIKAGNFSATKQMVILR
ncbi:T9SS type A sorting domain-containing protein [bacterium]|nr:T9SS type A sorting domain-containing protein [bacterium]